MKVLSLHGSAFSDITGDVEIQEKNWVILHAGQLSSISYELLLNVIGKYHLYIESLAGSEEKLHFGGSVFFDNRRIGDIPLHYSNGENNLLQTKFTLNVKKKGRHVLTIFNKLNENDVGISTSNLHLRIVKIRIDFNITIESLCENPDIMELHEQRQSDCNKNTRKEDLNKTRIKKKNDHFFTEHLNEVLFQYGSEYSQHTGNIEIQENDWIVLHPDQISSVSYDIVIQNTGRYLLTIKTLAGAEELLVFGGSVYFDNEFIGNIGIHWSTEKTDLFENNYMINVPARGQHTLTIFNKVEMNGLCEEPYRLHLRVIEISISIKAEVKSVIDNPALFGVNEEFIEILKEHISGLKEIGGGQLYENNFMGHVGAEHFKIYTEYINKFKKISGSVVLELGCGSGGSLPLVASYGAKVAGIEIDPNLVKLTNARIKLLKDAYCMQADGFHLPFANGTFDICVCSHVLEHVDRPHEMVEEINRVLKTGGIALIEFPNRLYPVEPHGNLLLVPYLPLKLARLYASILGSMWFISDEYRSRLNVLHLLKGEYSYFSINNIVKKLPFKICDVNPVDRLVLDHPVFKKYPNKVKRLLSLLISHNVTIVLRKEDR